MICPIVILWLALMDHFIELSRKGVFGGYWDVPYSENWSDNEVLDHWYRCYCNKAKLKHLPRLRGAFFVDCSTNQLESISQLDNIVELYCFSNMLTELPRLDTLKLLACGNNRLESLPEGLDNLKILNCCNNNLKTLPRMPQLEELICDGNPDLPFHTLEEWQEAWKKPSVKL